MRKILLILALAAGLAGCATRLSPAETDAKYGPVPSDYKEKIKAYMEPRLKEPGSGRYNFDVPPFMAPSPHLEGGWTVTFFLNAKNSYGGYSGDKVAGCLFRQGEIVFCHVGR